MLTEQAHILVDEFAKALKLAGGAIILGSVIVATVALLRDGLRTRDWRSAYPHYRSDIGRGILLGLELLVGADIIATITAPFTFESVGLWLSWWRSALFSVSRPKCKLRVAGPGSGPQRKADASLSEWSSVA